MVGHYFFQSSPVFSSSSRSHSAAPGFASDCSCQRSRDADVLRLQIFFYSHTFFFLFFLVSPLFSSFYLLSLSFSRRGLMLDPARHFIPIRKMNATIDAMAQNKLNTLHLHLTDGESFSVNTEQWSDFRSLSTKGAFAPPVSYTSNDLKAIVAHGRLRG